MDRVFWVPVVVKPGDPIPPGAYEAPAGGAAAFGGGAFDGRTFGSTTAELEEFKKRVYEDIAKSRAQSKQGDGRTSDGHPAKS